MIKLATETTDFEYPDVVHYWSSESEQYAGGDALITLVNQGWTISETIICERYWLNGSRSRDIYHMELIRDDDGISIAVLVNPYIRNLVKHMGLKLVSYEAQLAFD